LENKHKSARERFIHYFSDESNRRKLAPYISILFGLLAGLILMLLIGQDPIKGYINILNGSIFKGLFEGNFRRLGGTLAIATVLTFTGLSVAFAFKTGLFNIGVGGQMLFGGFIVVLLGNVLTLPKPVHLLVIVLAAAIGGALWALVPGILKARYRISEVVTTIMMNYVAMWTVSYFVRRWIPGHYETESSMIKESASLKFELLTDLFSGSAINLSIILAGLVVVFIWYILEKTTFGYELKAVGFNPDASKYAGMKVNRNILYSMIISGAIAGLAGASYYAGYTNHVKLGVVPNFGFDGIAVALLGLNSPFGVVLSALLFGVLRTGGEYLNAMTSIPKELVDIIVGLIIYFAAATLLIQFMLTKLIKKMKKNDEKHIEEKVVE
jgi:simple sugar transport system permease protein